MKTHLLLSSVAGAGFILFSFTGIVAAQDQDTYHNGRDAYFHGEHWHARLFDRVRQDVEHVRATTWPSGGGDEYRLDRTMHELDELQGKMANGVYDDRELSDVIDPLGRVASYNRMNPRERDILTDDVARLREYRDHHADWLRDR